jgi:hypothetical protein
MLTTAAAFTRTIASLLFPFSKAGSMGALLFLCGWVYARKIVTFSNVSRLWFKARTNARER